MSPQLPGTSIVLLALALSLSAQGSGRSPRSTAIDQLDPARVSWTRLRFEARKFFLKATTEVRFATGPRQDFDGQLIASPPGALEPRSPRISLLELDSSLAGRRSEAEVWFDPGDNFALQRRKLRHGKKTYQKTYRFSREGVFSRRRSPRGSAEGRRPAEWSRIEETFYAHPGKRSDCPAIIEPTMLLYMVSAAELTVGEPLSICAFSNKVLSRVELRPTGFVPIKVDYVEISSGGGRRRRGETRALRIAVSARRFDRAEGDFELLGLEGDVELFVDRGVPVEVGGRIPGFGRVQVRLAEVELR